jgi:hypothetical protein
MNNLNKKMSLALKLMTLAVIMNIATGCDSCKEKPKEGDKKVDMTLSFDPATLGKAIKESKLKITNNAEGELDISATSKLKIVVVATVTDTADKKVTTATELQKVQFEIEGGHKGHIDGEKSFELKTVVGKDKMASKEGKELKFKFTGAETVTDVKQVEFKVIVKDDKDEKKSTILLWENK